MFIHQSGLQGLRSISYQRANRVVISTFVERWQPVTNIIHISFGEMTITLDDVPTLVIYWWWVILWRCPREYWMLDECFVSLLGVSPQEAADELGMVRGSSVRLKYLRSNFFNVTDSHQIDIFNALSELICYIWSVALSSVIRVERGFPSTT